MRSVVAWERIARLTVVPERVENFRIVPDAAATRALLVAVHSHAPLPASVAAMPVAAPLVVVAIACCVPQVLPILPDVEYDDWRIASPSRHVMVWTRDPRQLENAG